jgi:hypothetical protein
MISILVIGPKVRRFKPSWGNTFLKEIKIWSMPSFKGEVTPSAPILWHIENHFYEQRYFEGQIHHILCQVPDLLLDDTAGRTARELLWTNQEFSPVNIIPPWFSMLIYHLGDEQQACWWPQFRDVVSPHQHDHHQSQLISQGDLELASPLPICSNWYYSSAYGTHHLLTLLFT